MSLVRADHTECVTHYIFSVEGVDSVPGIFSFVTLRKFLSLFMPIVVVPILHSGSEY